MLSMSDVKSSVLSVSDVKSDGPNMPDGKANVLIMPDVKSDSPKVADLRPNELKESASKQSDPNVPSVKQNVSSTPGSNANTYNNSPKKFKNRVSRKRKVFTIGDKILIIRDLENGKSQSKLAREMNIQQSTVSRMWKNRSKIISAFENDQLKSKRLKYTACKSVVASHTNGLILPKKPGLYITGPVPVLQPKIQEIAQFPVQVQQPVQARPLDNNWLQRFAVKHSIIISDVTGQTLVPVTSIASSPDWLNTMWLAMRKDYADNDIFHIDETGLFFRLTPEKTMTCLGEHCFGGKLASERVTVVLGTNMTGTEKRRLLVVGKCADQQLLASINNWPLKYASNNKAWMTSEIFESELHDWDVALQLRNRRILLLVSDCSAHARISNLKNIRLVYLPYHVASVRQPMGRGIFRSFKTHYRRLLMLQLIDCFEKNVSTSITMLDALRLLYKAWLRVPVEMIKNCFLQTGLMKSSSEGNVFEEFEDDIPLSLWLVNHNFNQFDPWKETIDWYVEADSELQTSEEPEEKNEEQADEEGSESSSDESVEVRKETEESFVEAAVPVTEALCALRKVSKFFEQDSACSKLLEAVKMEASLEKMILNTQLVKENV